MLGCRLHPSWTVVSDGGLRWKRRPWSPRGGSLSLTAPCRTTITNPGLRATSEVARYEDRDHRGNRPDRLGSDEPGGYSTMIIRASFPGFSGRSFDMSDMTFACGAFAC